MDQLDYIGDARLAMLERYSSGIIASALKVTIDLVCEKMHNNRETLKHFRKELDELRSPH